MWKFDIFSHDGQYICQIAVHLFRCCCAKNYFKKSADIWQNYCRNKKCAVFWDTVYIYLQHTPLLVYLITTLPLSLSNLAMSTR